MGSGQRHILHVFPTFDAGGLELRAVEIMKLLGSRARHSVLAMDGHVDAIHRLDRGIDVRLLEAPRNQRAWAVPLSMASLIKDVRPDLLLTYNWGAIESVLAGRLANAPVMVHHEDGFGPDEAQGSLARRTVARRMLLPAVRALIVPSKVLASIALTLWRQPTARVHHLPNGVDVRRFTPSQRPVSSEIVIGHVGRFRLEKNQTALIHALASSPFLRTRARLCFIGDGPLLGEARALASALGVSDRVEFVGEVRDPKLAYQKFDVFALSSITEQMPLSVLEAMATALPVVSPDVGDVAIMVAQENRPLLTKTPDPADLSRVLIPLVESRELRKKIGAANRARAEQVYPLDRCLGRFAELYLDLAAGLAPPARWMQTHGIP